MYFIAENDVHVCIRSEKKLFASVSGELMGKQRRVYAKFQRGIPDWVVPIAEEKLGMKMKPQEYTSQRWAGWYDSGLDQVVMGWTDEERQLIEQKLASIYGVIQVERPRVAAPWPAYDKLTVHGRRTIEHVVEKIVATVTDLELDPQKIVAYERENLNRPEVLAAFAAPVEVEEELVAA